MTGKMQSLPLPEASGQGTDTALGRNCSAVGPSPGGRVCSLTGEKLKSSVFKEVAAPAGVRETDPEAQRHFPWGRHREKHGP